jgi:hypothetical protein
MTRFSLTAITGRIGLSDAVRREADIPLTEADLNQCITYINHLTVLAHQYNNDLRYPPQADSVPRRLDAIDAVLEKVT